MGLWQVMEPPRAVGIFHPSYPLRSIRPFIGAPFKTGDGAHLVGAQDKV